MTAMRFGSAAALLAAMVAVTPAMAGKRDNSLRLADEQVLDNVDPYFNNVRIGVILSHQVWDTLIYRDPDSGDRDSEVRDLLARGDTSVDPSVRKAVYAKALALITERAYVLPLYSIPTSYVAAGASCSKPIPTRSRASGR